MTAQCLIIQKCEIWFCMNTVPHSFHKDTRKHRWRLTWAICLQLWSQCFSTLCASSTSCLRRDASVYMLPVESRAGGVPGELWPAGKCSQILLLMPFKPTETKQSYHVWLDLPHIYPVITAKQHCFVLKRQLVIALVNKNVDLDMSQEL